MDCVWGAAALDCGEPAAVARVEGDYVNAVYAYHKAIAALEYAVGRPLR